MKAETLKSKRTILKSLNSFNSFFLKHLVPDAWTMLITLSPSVTMQIQKFKSQCFLHVTSQTHIHLCLYFNLYLIYISHLFCKYVIYSIYSLKMSCLAPGPQEVQEADHAWRSGHESNEAVEGAHVTTVEGAPAEHPVHTLKGTARWASQATEVSNPVISTILPTILFLLPSVYI